MQLSKPQSKTMNIWLRKEITSPHLTENISEVIYSGDGRCVIIEGEMLVNIVKDKGSTCDVSTIHVLEKQGGQIIPTKKGFIIYDVKTGKFNIIENNKIVSFVKFQNKTFGFGTIIHFHTSGKLYLIDQKQIVGVTEADFQYKLQGRQKLIMKANQQNTILLQKAFSFMTLFNLDTKQKRKYQFPQSFRQPLKIFKSFYLLESNKALILTGDSRKRDQFPIFTLSFQSNNFRLQRVRTFKDFDAVRFQAIDKQFSTVLVFTKDKLSHYCINLLNYKTNQIVWKHITTCSGGVYRCIGKRLNPSLTQYVQIDNSSIRKKIVKYKKVQKLHLYGFLLFHSPILKQFGTGLARRAVGLLCQRSN